MNITDILADRARNDGQIVMPDSIRHPWRAGGNQVIGAWIAGRARNDGR